jgi:opacity protein-like surface antigen
LIRKAFPLLAAFSLILIAGVASAQVDTPPSAFEKQLHKLDLSINGIGIYNRSVTGIVQPGSTCAPATGQPPALPPGPADSGCSLTQFGSNTAGALVSLHYIARPYFGLEFNYSYARYTENFQGEAISVALDNANFQVQTKVNEYTFGYIATPPHPIFGFQPFVSAGFGTTGFKPTAGGGQELPERARATYYYSAGLQKDYGHLGLRAGFRETFFIAPDFGQNYLTIVQHTTTYEPFAGFYFRY